MAAGIDGHALQITVIGPQQHALVQSSLGAQLIEPHSGLLQNHFSGLRVHSGRRLIDEGIHLGIVQPGGIGPADGLAVVHAVEVGDGIGHGVATDSSHIVAFGHGAHVGSQVHAFDVGGNADLSQVGLDNFGRTLLGVVRADDGEVNARGVHTGLLHIFLGLLHIIAVGT